MATGEPGGGEHDWWTPEHPEDGLSWQEPDSRRRGKRRRALGSASRRGRRRNGPPRGSRLFLGPAGARRRRVTTRRRRLVALALVGTVALVVVLVSVLSGGQTVLGPPLPGLGRPASAGDPFAYSASRQAAFVRRASTGVAQVLFTKSPGGAVATAARVAAFRGLIDTAAKGSGIDPNLIEGIVFVESAGRPDAIAGTDPANASGLTQILASTGQSLLGMHVDLAASRRLSTRIAAAQASGQTALVARLERRRAAVDDRFVPVKALAATVRYLKFGEQHLGGRADLAVESYHMGIGNLQQVLSDYNGGTPVPYAQVYFDSSPAHNAATYHLLASFGDDSSLYLWRVLGAVQIMRLYRTDRAALVRLSGLETAYPSNALVLVPPHRSNAFADPAALSAAYRSRTLLPLPRNAGQLGLAYAATIGSDARLLKVPRGLYSGLRPAALDMLIEIAARVRAVSHVNAPLIVAATVTDAATERRLGVTDPPALTGYTFEIQRHYAATAQASAFQAVLDRLQALNLIAWIRGDQTIEITVSPSADQVIAGGV